MHTPSTVLWKPSQEHIDTSHLTAFIRLIEKRNGIRIESFEALHRWSLSNSDLFWNSVWDFAAILGKKGLGTCVNQAAMFPRPTWFPGASLNFAENLLKGKPETTALIFRGEDGRRTLWTRGQLREATLKLASHFKNLGIGSGDGVAGYLPNIPEAVVAMLATASLGATWTSTSPDFGIAGAVDRLGQVEPKVLISADGYLFKGKSFDSLDKARGIRAAIPSIQEHLIVPFLTANPPLTKERLLSSAISEMNELSEFSHFPFDHPLYVMFSSGTTGKPKCIVHGAGGTLIEHAKEHLLHTNIKPTDRFFYHTTTAWMMWNWHVSALATGATLILYDGAPLHNDGHILFQLAEEEGITIFGTSAKYLSMVEKLGVHPDSCHDLSQLHTILSTGSPLLPEHYDYLEREQLSPRVQVSSISGGTDIIGCFALGSPLDAVYRGELQAKSLGLDVQVFDEAGKRLPPEERGELVCINPFPSEPLYFLNDPTGDIYRRAYFDHYPGVWRHGDFVSETTRGGLVIYGRSDATLNPGGIRIGTADIYRQVEQIPEVLESLAVGREVGDDIEIVLFVTLRPGASLGDELKAKITLAIRNNTTPHHVPRHIFHVADLPRTKSGKIVELAVREIIHGREVKNKEALANPEALENFRDLTFYVGPQ